MTTAAISLRTNEEAWDLIKSLSTNTVDTNVALIFDEFPKIRFKYNGAGFNGTVSTRLCDVIYDLQREINKIYAIAVYNDPTHRLTKEEQDDLEIFVEVKHGSSELEANLGVAFNKIFIEGIKKMNSRDVMIVLTVATVVIGSYFISDNYFEHQKQINQQNVIQTMTQQETERLKVLKDIVREKPVAEKVIESGKNLGDTALKAIKPGETVEKEGVTTTYEEVKEKFKRTRTTPEEIEFSGMFYVNRIEVSETGEFNASIENSDSGEVCLAKINITEQGLKDSVLGALGSRQPIALIVSGRLAKKVKKDCLIVAIAPQA